VSQSLQFVGLLSSDALFNLTIVVGFWKFDLETPENDIPTPLETDVDDIMQLAADFYKRISPATMRDVERDDVFYSQRSFFRVEVRSRLFVGFAGILSLDPLDVNTFWSTKYRVSPHGERENLSAVRKYFEIETA
jgi:hypothetical protein